MLNRNQLDKLLRDSYANYVVQTSLDYADPIQRAQVGDRDNLFSFVTMFINLLIRNYYNYCS